MTTVDRFEACRDRLFGVAYRMTGSVVDAEDCVQEAWLRWQRLAGHDGHGLDPVDNDEAYLVRVVSRLAIDRQRRTAVRRETYVGPWLPEPIVTEPGRPSAMPDPAEAAELADSLSFAFLVVLDLLTPAERAAFILHDVFGVPFDEVAGTLDREPEACRQLASRARRKLRDESQDGSPARDPEVALSSDVLTGLLGALLSGDADGFLRLFAPDVVLVSDAGPNRRAARHHVVGPDRVGRLMLNLFSRGHEHVRDVRPVDVNGTTGVLIDHDDGPIVITGRVSPDGLVDRIWILMNPEKLAGVTMRPEG